MKIVMFGDQDSVILFNLIGIDGIIYEEDMDSEHFTSEFDKVLNNPEIGIVIITEKILIKHKEFIIPLKMNRRFPIIVQVPSIATKYKKEYLQEVVKQFIGIQI